MRKVPARKRIRGVKTTRHRFPPLPAHLRKDIALRSALGARDCDDMRPMFARRLLAWGRCKGYLWVSAHNEIGYRCGYIRVDAKHPWFGKHGIDGHFDHVRVHGGVTFSAGNHIEWWIGFDCAHAWDAPDPKLPGAHLNYGHGQQTIKSQEYVNDECRSLCVQAWQANKAHRAGS